MTGTRLLFEDFSLDPATRELRRGPEMIPLEPQVFDLLVYVIRNRDRVVSKDDLIEGVWGGRIVSESTLTTRINAVRKALGDSGEEQRLVRTVARKGIRFVGAVQDAGVIEGVAAVASSKPSDAPGLPLPDKPSIAVLPFQNMSGDPEQDYFSDGISEDIITALSKWQWLFIIARHSSFTYRGDAIDVRLIGHELGVRYVLEGSVRKMGPKVRITAQLIDATTGAHVWSERFDRDVADVFEVQDEISGRIAFALNIELTDAESRRRVRERPTDPVAVDLVFQARALQNRLRDRGRQQIRQVLRLLLQAAALDETTPGLYAELARAHTNDFTYGFADDREQSMAAAEAAAERALELDSQDASAHVSMGAAHRFRGRLDRALGEYRAALELNPNLALARSHLAGTLIQIGRAEEAYEEAQRAYRLDPRHRNALMMLALARLHSGHLAEAIEWARRTLEVAPEHWFGHAILAAALSLSGQATEARQCVAELLRTQSVVRSIRDFKALRVPGGPHWDDQNNRMYEALRAAGLPE